MKSWFGDTSAPVDFVGSVRHVGKHVGLDRAITVVALMSITLSSGGEGEVANDLSPMLQDEEVPLRWEDGQ
jgi:hypothetical protein